MLKGPRPYWDMQGDDDEDDDDCISDEVISFRSSSKGNSSCSPFPYDTRELFQRSISFSEYSNKLERRTETRRRYKSLPNLHIDLSSMFLFFLYFVYYHFFFFLFI